MPTTWSPQRQRRVCQHRKETIHMIQTLRKEACVGQMHDLAHVASADCLSERLTNSSAQPDALVRAVSTGILSHLDMHPPFRSLLKYKAFVDTMASQHLGPSSTLCEFLRRSTAFVTSLIMPSPPLFDPSLGEVDHCPGTAEVKSRVSGGRLLMALQVLRQVLCT